jgi:hypothetical protein
VLKNIFAAALVSTAILIGNPAISQQQGCRFLLDNCDRPTSREDPPPSPGPRSGDPYPIITEGAALAGMSKEEFRDALNNAHEGSPSWCKAFKTWIQVGAHKTHMSPTFPKCHRQRCAG